MLAALQAGKAGYRKRTQADRSLRRTYNPSTALNKYLRVASRLSDVCERIARWPAKDIRLLGEPGAVAMLGMAVGSEKGYRHCSFELFC